jgi:hypothetical protein
MAIRNILDYQGNIIGQLELPDGTSDEMWAEKLAPYAKAPPTPQEVQYKILDVTIQERKIFCDQLMAQFKKENILAGINVPQGLWMHQRVRAWETNFPGTPTMTVDILNMVVSGDVELATLALIYGTPDDMSQTYHWMSQARLNTLIGRLKAYLGWP